MFFGDLAFVSQKTAVRERLAKHQQYSSYKKQRFSVPSYYELCWRFCGWFSWATSLWHI